MKKPVKTLCLVLAILLFVASLIQLTILSIRFGSGHWVTICSSQTRSETPGSVWNDVYFTNDGQCHNQVNSSQDTLKFTVWVKDPWSFNLNFLGNIFQNKNLLTTTPKTLATPESTPAPTPTKTPIPQPAYSVSVLNQATWSENGFDFNVQIKNLSVKPYITNLAFYECNFIDNANTTYSGTLYSAEVHFNKALLPTESTNIEFKNVDQMSLGNGAQGTYGNSQIQYKYRDVNGNTVTKTIGGVKIVSCTAYISTDDSQASSGWGKLPITVKFP